MPLSSRLARWARWLALACAVSTLLGGLLGAVIGPGLASPGVDADTLRLLNSLPGAPVSSGKTADPTGLPILNGVLAGAFMGAWLPLVVVAAVGAIPASAAFYMMPTLIARQRKKTNALAIGVINFFFGWTVIGWVGALAWAVSTQVVDQP